MIFKKPHENDSYKFIYNKSMKTRVIYLRIANHRNTGTMFTDLSFEGPHISLVWHKHGNSCGSGMIIAS